MKFFFRLDASPKIGTGHLMRCLSLASHLKKKGFSSDFITSGLENSLMQLISEQGHKHHKIEKKENYNNYFQNQDYFYLDNIFDAEKTIQIIKEEKQPSSIIIDHYGIDSEWHKKLQSYCKKLIVIDDIANRKFECDVLMNPTYDFNKSSYDNLVSESCLKLIGAEYALIRPEFLEIRPKSKKKRSANKDLKEILIFMSGGLSLDEEIILILNVLDSIEWPYKPKINLVLNNNDPLIKTLNTNNLVFDLDINILSDVRNMAQLMHDSDLAIGSAGTASWERCCMGLPTLVKVIADNQKQIANKLENVGAISTWSNEYDLKRKLKSLISSSENLFQMSQRAFSIVDGKGVSRLADILLS